MKQLLFVFSVSLILLGIAKGQDLSGPRIPGQLEAADSSDQPASGSPANATNPHGYGSEGYGGRAEVFVSGFAVLTSQANGNSINHQATESGGFAAGYRFQLNSWSALEGSYGFSRNSQKYDIGGTVSSIPSYLSEITGSYVYRFAKIHRVQPFLEGGGGIVHFSPGNYGNGSGSSASTSTTAGGGGTIAPSPYSLISGPRVALPLATPVYTGSTPGIDSQTRPAFVYGAGIDVPAFSRFSLRFSYRGLAYKTPDFNQAGLQTNAFNFLSEPSFGIAYRF